MSTSANTSEAKLEIPFPDATYEEWRKAAEALLKGAPFEKRLLTQTHEGITFQPIYNAADIEGLAHLGDLPGFGGLARGTKAKGRLGEGWLISQELPYGTPKEWNAAARHDLMRGQTELNILLDVATAAGQDPDQAEASAVGACGLSLAHLKDLRVALEGVELTAVSLFLRSGASGLPLAALLLALAAEKKTDIAKLQGCVEIAPLDVLAQAGQLPGSLESAYREMALLTSYCAVKAPQMQTIAVHGTTWHDGGGSAVQELGYMLATGAEYLREMGGRGLGVDVVAPRMRFCFSVGCHFFMEIAKLRAARLCWAKVVEAFGGAEASRAMHLHARSSLLNKSRIDPHTNMLRGTVEAFGAALGGADAIHVSAYDEIFRLPDEFSRRIARNTQVILQEECELGRIIDPAGGSWFVEWLTDQIASKAWELFQSVEQEGGMAKAILAGSPQKAVAAVLETRTAALHQRRESMVGVNQYPDPKQKMAKRELPDYVALQKKRAAEVASYRTSAEAGQDTEILGKLQILTESAEDRVVQAAIEALSAGATLGEVGRSIRARTQSAPTKATPVVFRRMSLTYEQLRGRCECYEAKHGHAPQILQLNIGASRFYRARADWTSAFFRLGGFEVQGETDFKTVEEAVAAAAKSEAAIVLICSTDDTYTASAVDAAKQFKAACPQKKLLLAGAPGDNEAAWKEAGYDGFVHVRVNHFQTLQSLLDTTGVPA